ncbi:MAG TPA: RHS repeat-associated core domain-containing protein [Candidatus Binatia bacterium]|nr:RHS repeat-associated core domain-containing protein [Candidatus Binatia bacterium]
MTIPRALGTTNYLYDGANSLEELDNAGNVLARYAATTGVDEPLSELRASTSSYYQQDGLGSVTSLSIESGALPNTYTFDSFGKLNSSVGSLVNPFQYTGRDSDQETGLDYYRARYYDPEVGRFISEDPIGFDSGTNFYSYVSNSPIGLVDPFGLSQADVGRIKNDAQNSIDNMTKNGERTDPGWWNNMQSSVQHLNPFRKKRPYLGCGEQADRVALDIQNNHYNDKWTFTVEQDGLLHQRTRATSSNPTDPDIIIDPWKNTITPVPKGGK